MKNIDLSNYSTEDLKKLNKLINLELSKRGSKKRSRDEGVLRRLKRIHQLQQPLHAPHDTEAAAINDFNSRLLAKLPLKDKKDAQHREPYLLSLLEQDWSHLYPRDRDDGDFYVYAHVDPRLSVFLTSKMAGGNYGGKPFYIGKGRGGRAHDLKRNEGHGKRIKEILGDTYPPKSIVKILFSNLSEQKALEVEAKLIYFFGTQFSIREKGWLLNLTEPPTPKFETTMRTLDTKKEPN